MHVVTITKKKKNSNEIKQNVMSIIQVSKISRYHRWHESNSFHILFHSSILCLIGIKRKEKYNFSLFSWNEIGEERQWFLSGVCGISLY